jgi:hypothetical protein
MGTCTLTVDQTKILNHKSDASHADNDWINLVVTVNDALALNETIPLSNPKFTGQNQVNIFGDGDVALPWGFTVPCKNQDTVIATYSIINLSSYSLDDQAAAAAQFTQQVADTILPLYLKAAQIVLGVETAGVPQIITQLAGNDTIISAFSSALSNLMDAAFQDVLIPVLKQIADWVQILVTGRPDCNGLVLRDYVIFRPYQPLTSLVISKTYEGVQNNSDCGEPPHTLLNLVMTRQFDKIETGPLRPGAQVLHKQPV